MKNQRTFVFIPGQNPQLGLWSGTVTNNWSVASLDQKMQGGDLLVAISQLLADNKVKLTDLTSIGVMPGPASYTHLRIFVSTANTMAWILGLPIFAIPGDAYLPTDLPRLIGMAQKNQVINPIYPSIIG